MGREPLIKLVGNRKDGALELVELRTGLVYAEKILCQAPETVAKADERVLKQRGSSGEGV